MSYRLSIIYAAVILVVVVRFILASPPPDFPDGKSIVAKSRLLSNPIISTGSDQLQVSIQGQKVNLTVPQFSQYQYGDLLEVSGSIKRKVLDNKRVVYSIYFPDIKIIQNDPLFFYKAAGFVRERVVRAFDHFLPPDEASLLLGVVFGINSAISKDLKLDFQGTGVTHVVAASGMNVTLLAGFLLPIFLKFCKRQQALILTIFCLAFYTIISGLSASIVRATLMASIGYVGLIMGRQRTALISFFMTGMIMILLSPFVIFDIGFQLSFAATVGMLLLRPLFPSLSKVPILSLIEEDLTATVAAQITTLPILLFYFHSLGMLSILVNTLVLWTIPPLMVVGSIASVFALISVEVGGVVAFVCLPFLSYFILTIKFFASFVPILTISELPLSLILGYYLIVSGLAFQIMKRKNQAAIRA